MLPRDGKIHDRMWQASQTLGFVYRCVVYVIFGEWMSQYKLCESGVIRTFQRCRLSHWPAAQGCCSVCKLQLLLRVHILFAMETNWLKLFHLGMFCSQMTTNWPVQHPYTNNITSTLKCGQQQLTDRARIIIHENKVGKIHVRVSLTDVAKVIQ